jgi:hypothetical protein
VVSDEKSGVYKIVIAIEPHLFRGINEQIFQASEEDKELFKLCDIEILEHAIKKESALKEELSQAVILDDEKRAVEEEK